MYWHRNKTRSGMLAASNSIVAFLPTQSYANNDEIESLLSAFDASIRTPSSALQAAQYALQREWFRTGSVPAMELLLFSGSLGTTAGDERFITIAAAGLVSTMYKYTTRGVTDVPMVLKHHLSRGSVVREFFVFDEFNDEPPS
ncbi:hypothetical protein C0992_003185 [Termitomyces sp. T32_za158]|nr:hypothetical protein C0992_003185 [Termitomyces sp. T32_za158]